MVGGGIKRTFKGELIVNYISTRQSKRGKLKSNQQIYEDIGTLICFPGFGIWGQKIDQEMNRRHSVAQMNKP